jgi:branched-chain amino acid transport system permease protein
VIKVNLKLIVCLILVIILCFFPYTGNIHWTRVLIEVFIWTTVSIGFRLILTAGQLSLAQVSFMGLGAYTIAIMTTKIHLNYWICFPLAGIFTSIFALIIGYLSLRARGIHFAIATFAISEVIRLTWIEWKSLFGGVGGIPNIPSPNSLFGLEFGSVSSFYYFSLLLVIFTIIIMHRLEISKFGMILVTLEKSENLSQSVGINTYKYKIIAFIIGGFFAGLTGGVFATFYHYIGPEDFSIHQTFYVLIYVLTGGVNTIYGTTIGVFVLIIALKLIHHIPAFNPVWESLFLGCTLLLIMKFLPGGLISILQKFSLDTVLLDWRKRRALT